jgi:hypothetical protein
MKIDRINPHVLDITMNHEKDWEQWFLLSSRTLIGSYKKSI